MDVQGAGLGVVAGGRRTFAGAIVVMMEMPFYGEYNRGSPRFGEYTRVMEALGFIPFDIIEMHRTATSASHPCGYLF